MINDVLDIAKMEAGQVQWQMGAVALDEVIACSVDATHLLAEEQRLLIQTSRIGFATAMGDQDRLVQVVTNLLFN